MKMSNSFLRENLYAKGENKTSIVRNTMASMTYDEHVSMEIFVRICIAFYCGIDDTVEI